MGQNRGRCVRFIQFAKWQHRGRSLPSPTASCLEIFDVECGRYVQLLAEVFLEMLMGRDDCLRSLRMLLREVVRNVKHDMNFHTFAVSIMQDYSDTKLRDLDPVLKAKIFLSVEAVFLGHSACVQCTSCGLLLQMSHVA